MQEYCPGIFPVAAQSFISHAGRTPFNARIASKLPLEVHVTDFVVVPRRRSYWIEEIRNDGSERRVIACCPSEDDALEQLHYLRERQWAREHRRMAVEMSRFYVPKSVGAS